MSVVYVVCCGVCACALLLLASLRRRFDLLGVQVRVGLVKVKGEHTL